MRYRFSMGKLMVCPFNQGTQRGKVMGVFFQYYVWPLFSPEILLRMKCVYGTVHRELSLSEYFLNNMYGHFFFFRNIINHGVLACSSKWGNMCCKIESFIHCIG